jgi:GNAT superfamily N-acetyltransferase
MKILNLKEHPYLLKDYVKIRNTYYRDLLSDRVTIEQTGNWLTTRDVEVLVAYDISVIGACILHVYRNAEVTIFVTNTRKGIGSLLLNKIEELAIKRHIPYLWAWTNHSNLAAQALFKKNNYTPQSTAVKIYHDKPISGIVFEKSIL